MKKVLNICADGYFYLLLSFLFMINFSIAYCYISGILLLLVGVIYHLWYKVKPHFSRAFWVFIPLAAVSLLSSYFSMEPAVSFKDNRELLNFLLIPLIILILNSRKRLMISLFTLLLSTFFSSVFGIYKTIQAGRISLDLRLTGFTSHWMTYSELLMLVFIFFTIYLFYEKRVNYRVFLALALFFIGGSILLSLTRSVWIGSLFALGFFVLYHRRELIKYSIPVLIFVIILFPSPVKKRIVSIFDLTDASNRNRIIMIEKGWNIFKDYPLFGIGSNYLEKVLDTYPPAFEEPSSPRPAGERPQEAPRKNMHLHNNFIHILAERGIFALAAFVFAFGFLIIDLFKKAGRSRADLKFVPVGTLFCLIGFLVAGLFEYNFGDSEVLFMLLSFIALPYLRLGDRKDDPGIQN